MLNVDESQTFFIVKNPERANIKYCVEYVDNDKDIEAIFNVVISNLLERKERCPRRLILKHEDNVQVFIAPFVQC